MIVNDSNFRLLTASPLLQIVLAPVPPLTAGKRKSRPVLLLEPPSALSPDTKVRVVAGSTVAPNPEDEPFTVFMEVEGVSWKDPATLTLLPENTWFYADWVCRIKLGDIEDFYGVFPKEANRRLLSMVNEFYPPKRAEPPPAS